MSLRLVRETSDTPNITNKDDVVMIKYAYGGDSGVVKNYSEECSAEYNVENHSLTIKSGRIVIDGWEVDVPSSGESVAISSLSGTYYYCLFLEIDVSIESASLKYTYSASSYPEVTSGDNLTVVPAGKARLLLYKFKITSGTLDSISREFKLLKTTRDLEDELKSGEVVVQESRLINGLYLIKNSEGLLRIGDVVIPQKKLVAQNTGGTNTYIIAENTTFKQGDVIEIEWERFYELFGEKKSYLIKTRAYFRDLLRQKNYMKYEVVVEPKIDGLNVESYQVEANVYDDGHTNFYVEALDTYSVNPSDSQYKSEHITEYIYDYILLRKIYKIIE